MTREEAIRCFEKLLLHVDTNAVMGIDTTEAINMAIKALEQPTIEQQRKTDEWCTDCKEYDQERHCCPRWNRVIRQTLKDAQPDIIHCVECKHRDPEDHKCDCGHDILWQLPRDDRWYCADAERKEGEADGVY